MTIPIPNLSLKITPPGGAQTDYSNYLTYDGAAQQTTITQNFGRQGDTAILVLVDEYTSTPNVIIKPLSTIKLTDNNLGKVLFAGVVVDPTLNVTSPTRNEWILQCTDYTYYADNAIARGIFIGYTIDQILISLTATANCGISARSTSEGGFVYPAPQIGKLSVSWKTLSDIWKEMSTLAGTVLPYGWYVDENLTLHFFDSSSAISSGVTFTTAPTTGGSATEGHFAPDSQFEYEWDGSLLHNRILVQGATQTIKSPSSGPPTDTFIADGGSTSWPLRYTSVTVNHLTVNNGKSQSVVSLQPGTPVPVGTLWSAQQNANGQYFLIAATAPSAGSTIKIWYDYKVPIIAQVNDYTSQAQLSGPNGGVFAEYISDTSLTTAEMALARAQRERQEYSTPAERITFDTTEEWIGWIRAGETCKIINQFIPDSENNWALGINDTFIVIQNRITFTRGGYRTMELTAVRV